MPCSSASTRWPSRKPPEASLLCLLPLPVVFSRLPRAEVLVQLRILAAESLAGAARHRVDAPLAARMAAGDAPDRHHPPLERAVNLDRLDGIARAAGPVAAAGAEQGAQGHLVDPDQGDHQPCQGPTR